jgi:exopolysaccharide biosynthesis protein
MWKLVLSIGPAVSSMNARLAAGAELIISTATTPNLRGAKTAIGGGPVLVRDGKRQRIKMPDSDSYEFSSMMERHPRSAIGWNEAHFFLVTVDGRQNASVGMSLDELASFLVELGCRDAVNLDRGGSATLWYNDKVRNRPCDGGERAIANSLVVLKKQSERVEQTRPQAASAGQRP